jgi:hypothetical protein
MTRHWTGLVNGMSRRSALKAGGAWLGAALVPGGTKVRMLGEAVRELAGSAGR